MMLMLSMRHPEFDTETSLAMRQRKTIVCPVAAGGKNADVVMNPAELPVQAARPPIGLLNAVEMVPL